MGQDNEQRAELIATIQHDHVAMKTWYNTNADARLLHTNYSPTYPAFWRDVVNWDGWKDTRKLYLKSIEGKINSNTGSNSATSSASMDSNAVPRKRKSRWAAADNTDGGSGPGPGPGADPPRHKSRWASGRDPTPVQSTNSVLDLLPGMHSNLSSSQSVELSNLQKTLRECNARVNNLESEAARIDALPIGHRERSPSPPPIYGPDGKKKNTRAVRWRERYTGLRQDTLEKILKLTTGGNAAAAVAPSLFNRKRTKKVYIPVEKHPTYNFIGLIIGPRGKTQKEMEGKTGCKIAIRGKGSVKEGARGRRDGKIMEGDDEPLHVVVTGDNQENVEKAAQMIEDMLIVIDDDKNVHKQTQLRELALLNGTLKEDEYCSLCAEKGHRAFECPKRFSMNKPGVEIKCAICGDTSHPTRDCKQKDGTATVETKDTKQLDSDYLAFMNELDGKPANAVSTEIAPPRQSLVTSIGADGKPIGRVLPICQPIVVKEIAAIKPATGSLITTISSRVVKAPTDHAAMPFTTESASFVPAVPAAAVTIIPSAPPPSTAGGAIPVNGTLPPPPAGFPPPPHAPATYSYGQPQQPPQQQYQPYQQQQQYGYAGYQQGDQGYQGQGYQAQQYGNGGQGNGHGNGQQGNRQQGGQQGNGQQGNGAGGWDYRSYYGNNNNNAGNGSGAGSGAGGFNWWDS